MKLRLALVAEQWIMIKLIFLIEKIIKDLFVRCYTALLEGGGCYTALFKVECSSVHRMH